MESNEKSLWQVIKGYFNALPDKENEEETIQQISSGIAFHRSNLCHYRCNAHLSTHGTHHWHGAWCGYK